MQKIFLFIKKITFYYLIIFSITACSEKSVQMAPEKKISANGPTAIAQTVFQPIKLKTYRAAQARDPFQTPQESNEIDLLQNVSIDSLRLIGILRESQKAWALMRGLNGHIYRVSVGDHLTHDKYEVVSIENKQVIIKEKMLSNLILHEKLISFTLGPV